MIKVNALYFKAAHLFVSKEETRYYLNGVYIQPHARHGAVLTATDGSVLFSIHDPEGVCDRATVVSLPKGVMTAKTIDGCVEVSDQGIFRHRTYISEKSCVIDGTYPDYRRICERWVGKHTAPPAVNVEKVECFLRAARMLRSGTSSLRFINGESQHDPVLISITGVENAFGILMPMRASEPPAEFKWFIEGIRKPKPQPKVAVMPAPEKAKSKSIIDRVKEKFTAKKAA